MTAPGDKLLQLHLTELPIRTTANCIALPCQLTMCRMQVAICSVISQLLIGMLLCPVGWWLGQIQLAYVGGTTIPVFLLSCFFFRVYKNHIKRAQDHLLRRRNIPRAPVLMHPALGACERDLCVCFPSLPCCFERDDDELSKALTHEHASDNCGTKRIDS